MTEFQFNLKKDEEAVFLLRSLFESYGYRQFKMNKFEEYDLYVRNKDFLISDNIITFTDTNGKLLALKPDVTLSIVKNARPDSGLVEKVYYDENVYRVSGGTNSFKEIMQVGIECIGDMDEFQLYEVLSLAAKSLLTLSDDVVLDISHFGMLTDLIDSFGVSPSEKKQILKAIGEKNLHEISRLCALSGVSSKDCALLSELVSVYGKPCDVMERIILILKDKVPASKLALLQRMVRFLSEDGFGDVIRIDFSVVNHTDYYNGIVFKGFVKGIPASVLSGGQYDRLMEKMGNKCEAVGFAVYLDLLENFYRDKKDFDIDVLLTYSDSVGLGEVQRVGASFREKGRSVLVLREGNGKVSYREHYHITEGGVKLLEGNA